MPATPVFDIEAIEWTTPIAVGFYDGKKYYQFLKVSETHDVIWEFLSHLKRYKGLKVFAHNAAAYDNKFILDTLTKHDQEVKFSAGLGSLQWVGSNIRFEDSFLLLGRKLAVCCEAFGVSRKLEWHHDETRSPWEMQPMLDTFEEYLKRDCISLSEVLDAYTEKLIHLFGVTPSSTMALTAVKAFDKRFYPLKNVAGNEDYETFLRTATYGGRNEVYKRYGENLNFYDIKRMFMSCYDIPVPVGKMGWRSPNIDRGTCAEAWVRVPDMEVGPLPYRYEGRLIFPVGEFKSWWDMVELRNAVQYGVDVTLTRQLECEELPILKPFAEFIDSLSRDSNADMSRIWKLFGLRLSGKFGQHKVKTEIKHVRDTKSDEYNPLDSSEIYHEVLVPTNGYKSPYIKPAINMRVRAEARVRHYNKLLEAKDIYYCDTDSIYTTSSMAVGDGIGTLQLIERAQRAYFIGGKFYGYVNSNGTLKQKTAGYRDYQLTEYDFQRVLKGEEIPVSFTRIGDWKSVLKESKVRLEDRTFTYRLPGSSNRIMGAVDTAPIKLLGGKVTNCLPH